MTLLQAPPLQYLPAFKTQSKRLVLGATVYVGPTHALPCAGLGAEPGPRPASAFHALSKPPVPAREKAGPLGNALYLGDLHYPLLQGPGLALASLC